MYKRAGMKPPDERDGKAEELNDWLAVKAVPGTDNELEILVPYGGPFNGADRDGDYFTPRTQFDIPGMPPVPRPVVYAHALADETPDPIGHAKSYRDAPEGRWYQVVLDTAKAKARQCLEALKRGTLRASSQPIQSFVRGLKNGQVVKGWPVGGEITHWGIAELTLVDEGEGNFRAANPFAVVRPLDAVAAKASLRFVGLELPDGREAEAEGLPSESEQQRIERTRRRALRYTSLS